MGSPVNTGTGLVEEMTLTGVTNNNSILSADYRYTCRTQNKLIGNTEVNSKEHSACRTLNYPILVT